MRVLFYIIALVFAGAALADEGVKETPATPLHRTPPDYPAACVPPTGEQDEPQSVTLMYDVSKDGLTENVRVRESTNSCFEEVAVAAVRNWRYAPRRVNDVTLPQEDLETTITFVLAAPTEVVDFDARPILRVPPQYPERCADTAKSREVVYVEFDVTEEGTPENIRVIESTNSCLNGAAQRAVAKWRYRPKTVSGKPVRRKGVQTQMTFEITSGRRVPPELKVRRAVRGAILNVQNDLHQGGDPQQALADLAEIEKKYGDTFSPIELTAFLMARAEARIKAGDYAAALDDLRAVQRSGMAGEASEAVDKTIEQLEAALAPPVSGASQSDENEESPQ